MNYQWQYLGDLDVQGKTLSHSWGLVTTAQADTFAAKLWPICATTKHAHQHHQAGPSAKCRLWAIELWVEGDDHKWWWW